MNMFVMCSVNYSVVEIRMVMTAATAHAVASVFTDACPDLAYAQVLREAFGVRSFRWYCIDMSDTVYRVTFSNVDRPRLCQFGGQPVSILPADAEDFRLYLSESTAVKLEQIPDITERPHSVESLLETQGRTGDDNRSDSATRVIR